MKANLIPTELLKTFPGFTKYTMNLQRYRMVPKYFVMTYVSFHTCVLLPRRTSLRALITSDLCLPTDQTIKEASSQQMLINDSLLWGPRRAVDVGASCLCFICPMLPVFWLFFLRTNQKIRSRIQLPGARTSESFPLYSRISTK